MKYPIGIQTFEKIIEEGYTYVDKTEMIYSLAHGGSIYFLSRPRRFGKSLLISTLESYFLGKKELFKGLAISDLETEWDEYPVFHIDFNSDDITEPNVLEKTINFYIEGWEKDYGIERDESIGLGRRFAQVLAVAHEKTGRGCVVLVDEYDKPLLDVMDSGLMTVVNGNKMTVEDKNRETLKAFYSTFKTADKDLKFVFLTGVTKFSQVSVFSGFNQPDDISMDREYDTICGITEEEIDEYFTQSVAELAEDRGVKPSDIRRLLKKTYDGYHFSKRMREVYNPFSLLNAFKKKDIGDYWFKTATPTYLVRLLEQCHDGVDELAGKYYSESLFYESKANEISPLPIIYQSGYLSIKGYDSEDNTYLIDFPNNEVKRGFVSLIAGSYFKKEIELDNTITTLNKCLRSADLDKFRDVLTAFLASIPYTMRDQKATERHFHYTFYLILRLMSTYLVYTEKCQSQGRVDCVIETKDNIYVLEFKLDGSATEALQQTNDKGYAQEYVDDSRRLFKVGCVFSSQTGTVGEWLVNEEFLSKHKKETI